MFPVVRMSSRHGLRSSVFAVAAVLLSACCLLSLSLSFVLTGAPTLQDQRKLLTAAKAVDAAVLEVDEDAADTASAVPTGAYVAMNRFRVREGSGPAFEQRWAQRKSSLRKLQGFQWFGLLRRVQSPDAEDDYTYSSFTWWANKKNFNSWRKGPAFKEAHGGGDIFNFLGMILNGFLTSKGPPKPCFWKAESVVSNAPLADEKFQGGPGSRPDFDGSKEMDSEVFVSMRRFGNEEGIEKVLTEEANKLAGASGLRFAQAVTRDQEPDDGAGAALITVWKSKKDYEASPLTGAPAPPRGEALYEGILVLEK